METRFLGFIWIGVLLHITTEPPIEMERPFEVENKLKMLSNAILCKYMDLNCSTSLYSAMKHKNEVIDCL